MLHSSGNVIYAHLNVLYQSGNVIKSTLGISKSKLIQNYFEVFEISRVAYKCILMYQKPNKNDEAFRYY